MKYLTDLVEMSQTHLLQKRNIIVKFVGIQI